MPLTLLIIIVNGVKTRILFMRTIFRVAGNIYYYGRNTPKTIRFTVLNYIHTYYVKKNENHNLSGNLYSCVIHVHIACTWQNRNKTKIHTNLKLSRHHLIHLV